MASPEAFSSLSHLLAAPAALVCGAWTVARMQGPRVHVAALVVFTAAAVTLLVASGMYHSQPDGTVARELFRRLDHTAIWVMIAGSYTAIHMLGFQGRWRWVPPAILWAVALFGIVFKALYFESLSELAWLAMYFGVGWLGLASIVRLALVGRWDIVWPFALGGAVYTLGAVYEYARVSFEVVAPHEVFHLAVLGGIAIHWRLLCRLQPEMSTADPTVFLGLDGPTEQVAPVLCVAVH